MIPACRLCPRDCGVPRGERGSGVCRRGSEMRVARAALHFWEEPPISGSRGSGTVFFSGCNLKCTGCWAAEYGNLMNLAYEEMDDIVNQGVEMGTYVYLFTGGEPMVRKKDIIRLCEDHPDCVFSTFTNGTLIDEAFAEEMLRVQNFVPAISIEGFEEATDSRRGNGTYQKIIRAMNILREKKLPFGISCCYTSANAEVIGSEAYFDQMIDMGAKFA